MMDCSLCSRLFLAFGRIVVRGCCLLVASCYALCGSRHLSSINWDVDTARWFNGQWLLLLNPGSIVDVFFSHGHE